MPTRIKNEAQVVNGLVLDTVKLLGTVGIDVAGETGPSMSDEGRAALRHALGSGEMAWVRRASCASVLLPDESSARAKAICKLCPVRPQSLLAELANGLPSEVRGGLDASKLVLLKRTIGLKPAEVSTPEVVVMGLAAALQAQETAQLDPTQAA